MKERELTEDIVKRLGIDPTAGWSEFTDGESSDILVRGVCDIGDEFQTCPLVRSAIFNIDTGKMLRVKCPSPSQAEFDLCFWEDGGISPIGKI